MDRFDRLEATHNAARKEYADSLMRVANQAGRVAGVARNAEKIIDDIDAEFERITKLGKLDIGFLFLATALQCCRQYLLTDFKVRLGDKEAADKTLGHKTFDPHDATTDRALHLYNPSLEEIISHPVPFDTTRGSANFGHPFKGGGILGHRATTLGHDPILGWVFGTANIATSTVTLWNLKSFHVGSGAYGDYLHADASTPQIFSHVKEKMLDNGIDGKMIMAASLIKEAVHLCSDIHTKHSLPIPIVSRYSPKLASELAKYGLDMENVLTVGKQATYAVLINHIIAMVHRMFYDEEKDKDPLLYEVRTRKVLLYSNLIATSSNLLVVAIGSAMGVASHNPDLIRRSLQKLDIGGFAVTMYRLVTDVQFITAIKKEFIEQEFYNQVMGDSALEGEQEDAEA